MTSGLAPRMIDPLTPAPGGRYEDDVVTVVRARRADARHAAVARTKHFDLHREDGRLHLCHALPKHRVDNDLAGLLTDELFGPGWASGGDTFERILTGIVLTSADEPLAAWELFYRNTLRRLEFLQARTCSTGGHGSLAAYAPVYAHASRLIPSGSVLEVGSCFGFLSLELTSRCTSVTATDVSASTVDLLARVACRLGYDLATLACDAARVPRPDLCFDSVAVIHLLEHLDPEDGEAVVGEAIRLARRRVVVAVPYEDEPNSAFGHVRALDAQALTALGRATGWDYDVHDRHGGWLVLDRPA
jgi:hypothetical protein